MSVKKMLHKPPQKKKVNPFKMILPTAESLQSGNLFLFASKIEKFLEAYPGLKLTPCARALIDLNAHNPEMLKQVVEEWMNDPKNRERLSQPLDLYGISNIIVDVVDQLIHKECIRCAEEELRKNQEKNPKAIYPDPRYFNPNGKRHKIVKEIFSPDFVKHGFFYLIDKFVLSSESSLVISRLSSVGLFEDASEKRIF